MSPSLLALWWGGRYEPWSRRLLRIKAGEAGNVVLYRGEAGCPGRRWCQREEVLARESSPWALTPGC